MNILVGYDGSNAAKAALEIAQQHAKAFDGFVHVVTSMTKATDVDQKEIADDEGALEYTKSFLEKAGIPCETHLLIRGLTAGEDLIEFAKEKKIDEIVVGVKRRSKVSKLLMGSSAQYVILNAACPVVCVK